MHSRKSHLGHVILLNLAVVAAAITCASCVGTFKVDPSIMSPEQWSTPGGNFQRTGSPGEDGPSPPLELAWKKQYNSGVSGLPVVAGKTVLIPLLNGELIALKLHSGEKIHRKRFDKGPLHGLTLVENVAFWAVTQDKKTLRAYNLETGRHLWKVKLGRIESAPVVREDHLFIGSLNSQFYCLDIRDGNIVWSTRERHAIRESAVIYGGHVFYCDVEGVVYARRVEDGEMAWELSLPGQSSKPNEKPYTFPVISDGLLYVTTMGGSVFSLNAQTGENVWRAEFEDPIFAPASIDHQNLYVPTSSGKVHSVSKENGKINWTYDAGTIINSQIAVLNAMLAVTTVRGDILLLQKSTGHPVWTKTLKHRLVSPPVLAAGYLIVSDDQKWIYAFSSREPEANRER